MMWLSYVVVVIYNDVMKEKVHNKDVIYVDDYNEFDIIVKFSSSV